MRIAKPHLRQLSISSLFGSASSHHEPVSRSFYRTVRELTERLRDAVQQLQVLS
jgi:hypothetical protein